jgi:hypothetical protein
MMGYGGRMNGHGQDNVSPTFIQNDGINPLNSELNPICHLLELLEAHHILHVSKTRVNLDCINHKHAQAH